MRTRFALALAVIVVLSWQRADAVIVAKTPLIAIEGSSTYVLVGKVDKYLADKPAMMVTITEAIKGKAPFRDMPINLKVADEKTFKNNKIEPLLKRFGPGQEIVFFLKPQQKDYVTFAFVDGTWFQLLGTQVEKDRVVFSLVSAEPYFRKTFSGTTEEMRKVLKDYRAKKGKLPPLNDKLEPGFGPEYSPKKQESGGRGQKSEVGGQRSGLSQLYSVLSTQYSVLGTQNFVFGVIPTMAVGAPLALLAMMFPSIFGGVFVLFRQWLAFITVISINSSILLVHWLLGEYATSVIRESWWSTPAGLWFIMTVVSMACALWAWRRQLNALSDGDNEAPARTELIVLLFMAVSCVVTTIVLWCISEKIRWTDPGWTSVVVTTLAVGAGTAYRICRAVWQPQAFAALPVTTEGIIIGAMLVGHVAFVPIVFGRQIDVGGTMTGKQQSGNLTAKAEREENDDLKPMFVAPENIRGMFASSPTIDGDAIYACYSDAFQKATMVRLDRHTGVQKWAYERSYFRQMISTPCIADGKLYFGEGFHHDTNCAVFCLDASDGTELWRFPTGGQTESSPTVANGKLYIGAGNDGVYCLDVQKSLAKKEGVVAWRFPPAEYRGRLLRFGGGMRVVGSRLYCGSAEDRDQKGDKGETAVFCFNANNGDVIWKTPAPYPVWSTPVVKDGLVYVTSGNGDVLEDTKNPEGPGGALQCLDAATGKEQWRIKLPNGVIDSPAVDGHRIYFGCRNAHIYCVRRADGKELWKYFLHSPIIGTPVLDSDPVYERSLSVFVVTTNGKACCMVPQTGDIVWTFDLTKQMGAVSTSARLVVTRTADGYRRQLYFGGGVGGGLMSPYENRPVLYCPEDKVRVE